MRIAAAVFVLLALVIPVAAAEAEPSPLELLDDTVEGILAAQSAPRVCPELSIGTAGTPENGIVRGIADRGNGLPVGAPTSAPRSLPGEIHLRSTNESFNRRYWFALRRGRLYYKSNAERTGIEQPWASLPTPPCFDGDVTGISADDDELIAIDSSRQIFTMDGALEDPALFNWTVRWGPVFWTGAGRTLPPGEVWSWSVSSPLEDRTFTDPAGNAHPIGEGKVSHVWLLGRRGQRLTYMDPWLPADQSYEMCGPKRGRFRAVDMSASGSTVFVINRRGDMFTRLYDFDISGPDSFFVDYSYDDQRGLSDPVIQLPPEGWTRQPKIPGRITSAISIEKRGAGSTHRTLRVEGLRRGRSGYWEKDVTEGRSGDWRFRTTRSPLHGRPLANPRANTTAHGLGETANARFAARLENMRVEIENFNVYCSPARLEVRVPGEQPLGLILHTTDDIRQTPRARGLDDDPRLINGTIEAPQRVLGSTDPWTRLFVERYLPGGRFTNVRIEATRERLRFPALGWALDRAAV